MSVTIAVRCIRRRCNRARIDIESDKMNEQQSATKPARNIGDRIRFRGVSFVWSEKKIYEGVIRSIMVAATIGEECELYYHVDAMIGSEHIPDGIVYEHEVVNKEA